MNEILHKKLYYLWSLYITLYVSKSLQYYRSECNISILHKMALAKEEYIYL